MHEIKDLKKKLHNFIADEVENGNSNRVDSSC